MRKFIILMTLIGMASTSSIAVHPNDKIDPNKFNTKLFEKALLYKINEYRKENSKRPLLSNTVMYKVAKDHTDFLKTQKELTHDQPTEDKQTVKDRVQFYLNVTRFAAAENLARTFILKPTYNYDRDGNTTLSTATTYFEAAEYMLNAWIQSEFHNKNLLSDKYVISGLAAYFNPKDYSLTATQVFARID